MPDDDSDSDEVVPEAEAVLPRKTAARKTAPRSGGALAEPAEPAALHSTTAFVSFSERLLQLTLEANLAKVSDLFRDWDKNADRISRAEFTRALGTLQLGLDAAEIDDLFDGFDRDGSGAIDFREMRKELYRAKERREGREADAAATAKDDGSDGDSDEGNADNKSTRRRPTEHELLELNMGARSAAAATRSASSSSANLRRPHRRRRLAVDEAPPRPRTAAAAARPSSLSPPPGWEPAPTFGAGRPPALVRLALGLPASAADVSPEHRPWRPRSAAPLRASASAPVPAAATPRGRGPPWRPAAAACGRAAPPPATRGPPRRARRAAASSRTSAPRSSRRRV